MSEPCSSIQRIKCCGATRCDVSNAEAIRDAQLSVAGQLDYGLDGPYVATTRTGTAEVIIPEDRQGHFVAPFICNIDALKP